MKSENLPNSRNEQYSPGPEAPDEAALTDGGNRLTYILVGLILALVVGYIALPKGHGADLAAAPPTATLDDATVTAAAPAAAPKAESAAKASDKASEEMDNAKPGRKAPKAVTAAPAGTEAPATAEPAATAAPEAAEAASAAAMAAEPAAPATTTITGRMEDENGHPLVGATVLLKGSSKGTSTDANGSYSLEIPAGNDNSLIYGYGGYDDEVVHVSGSKPVNVILTPRAKASRNRR